MSVDYDALHLLAAAAIGFVIAWWVARLLYNRRFSEAQCAVQEQLEQSRQEIVRLTEESAAARARTEQLPTLETALKQRDTRLSALQEQLTATRQRGARLETIIRRDRQAMREKLTFMENWQSRMADAYKALSATALKVKNNNLLK